MNHNIFKKMFHTRHLATVSLLGCMLTAVTVQSQVTLDPVEVADASGLLSGSAYARELFTTAAEEKAPAHGATSEAIQSRVVETDVQTLADIVEGREQRLVFNLFEEARFVGIVERKETRSSEDYTLFGRLLDQDNGRFTLVVYEEAMVGNVVVPGQGTYSVHYLGNGLHAVIEEGAVIHPCEVDSEHMDYEDEPVAVQTAAQGICNHYDDGSVIDLLVVYTAAAEAERGGPAGINAFIQFNVDNLNTSLANSRVTPRVHRVAAVQIAYTDSGDRITDLNRLTNPSDGYMDDVEALRSAYHADLVALVVRCAGCGGVSTCVVGDFSPTGAFFLVSSDWTTGFAHECGHNLGCGHNLANGGNGGCAKYPYSLGWDFVGNNGLPYSTVMSYGAGGVVPSVTIPYFSNPDVLFMGQPTGSRVPGAEANNARTINENAFRVANYKQRPGNTWVDFAYFGLLTFGCFEFPYNLLDVGVNAVPTDGTLIFKAGSTTATGTISKRITMKAFGGPVRIGA